MRLIDADSLKEGIKELKQSPWYNNDINPSWRQGIKDAVHVVETLCIDEEPTVDAVPVRHGKWIIRDNPGTGWYRITCSECGEDVTSTAPCIGFFPNAKVVWDYCPYCGARMDEERKEE